MKQQNIDKAKENLQKLIDANLSDMQNLLSLFLDEAEDDEVLLRDMQQLRALRKQYLETLFLLEVDDAL